VKHHRPLPATLLVRIEFAEISDHLLTRSRLRPHTLDECVVDVLLAVFGACILAQKHGHLLAPLAWSKVAGKSKEVGLHYTAESRFHYRQTRGIRAIGSPKPAKNRKIILEVRKLG
jgi:hypothetical protein